jgi:hypothetical protein
MQRTFNPFPRPSSTIAQAVDKLLGGELVVDKTTPAEKAVERAARDAKDGRKPKPQA